MTKDFSMNYRPRYESEAKKPFHIRLWFAMLVFFALILARDLLGIGVPRIAFTLWLAVVFFFSEENMDIAVLVSTLAFNTRINYNEITLVFLVIFFFRRYKKTKMPSFVILYILVLFLELLGTFFASGDLMVFFRFAVLMLVSMVILITPTTRIQLVTILKSYVFGIFVAMLDVMVLTFREMSLDRFLNRGYRLGTIDRYVEAGADEADLVIKTSSDVTNFNPNMLACFAGAAIFLLFILWYTKQTGTVLSLSVGAFILFGGLLTQGRAMLLSLIFFAAYVLLCSVRNAKSFFSTFAVIVIMILVLLLLISGPLDGVYERYVYRFTTEDVSNGRVDIWKRIVDSLTTDFRAFFFGYGIRHYAEITGGSSAHNTFFEIMASWGIVGFASIMLFNVYSVIHQMAQTAQRIAKKKIRLIFFGPLFAFVFSLFGTHLYTITVYTCVFALTQIAIRMADYEEFRLWPKAERIAFKAKERAADKAGEEEPAIPERKADRPAFKGYTPAVQKDSDTEETV